MKDIEEFIEDSSIMFKNFEDEARSVDYVIREIIDIFKIFEFLSEKKKKLKEEEINQFYNVYVYQELPYPPGSKFSNKFI